MRTLRAYNPEQPAAKFRPIQSIVDHAVSPRRFFVLLVTIFAGLGLVLAGVAPAGSERFTPVALAVTTDVAIQFDIRWDGVCEHR